MSENTVFQLLGRRLRLAVIGGGPGSFIGAMHRQAARWMTGMSWWPQRCHQTPSDPKPVAKASVFQQTAVTPMAAR